VSATVSFTYEDEYAAAEIEITGPQRDQPVDGPARFVTGRTANGTRYSYVLNASAKRLWTMQFVLTAQEKEDLEGFFYDSVGGPSLSFTFTSTSGDEYEDVRFVNTSLQLRRIGPAEWAVSITLEVDGILDPQPVEGT
jgi:hypothetical protein